MKNKYIIFPDDPTLIFMRCIFDAFESKYNGNNINIISCNPSSEGYKDARELITNIKPSSTVVFIGHSTPSLIYGGASVDFNKQPLLKIDDMGVFSACDLILVSCFSKKLLESSRQKRAFSHCIGFGLIPSEFHELQSHPRISRLGLLEEDLEVFKQHFSIIIRNTLKYLLLENGSLESAFLYMRMLLNKAANQFILKEKNHRLAELLYYIVSESYAE
ncbi:hypothetical protein [Aeromonas dhakensis]|uniref:hypothetical protein n=1 Tax=Aeromonas dhakensis TaxID=196024 RepID=UPI0019825B03|nr:hypothetical protein [Aeromonas dhakensis]MBW3733498.1 hypothetical protein [Aeromonas dhakensis]QSR54667.1 hypothetical protein GO601_04025 [Aeromonas dhakensis]